MAATTPGSKGTDAGQENEAMLSAWADRVIARGNLPRHVAIIMDGNGRWAQRRHLPRVAGHRAGRHAVRRAVRICSRLGINVLTLYTFSQENWKRPPDEVRALWSFLEETLAAERKELHENRVQLVASGELETVPESALTALKQVMDYLAGNDGLIVNLALAYGGRTEILRAATMLARRIAAGELSIDAVTEQDFRAGLYSPELPDPDLVIRTSGESRLSNFLLWQSAYAEFHVTKVLWPDFKEADLLRAIADYQNRERRFGAVRGAKSQERSDRGRAPLDAAVWKKLLRIRS
jgi:undecaprenyl diphosphate synthase